MTNAPRAFVMGHPISHSRSPMLHGYWLKLYGLPGSYERLDVAPAELAAFFADFAKAGWAGGNVTAPHKSAVIPLVDRLDEAARAIGAVNTLWLEDGKLVGGNTDAIGFLGNLDELAPGWRRSAQSALVLGAGGAARAAAHGLLQRGLTVALCNRTPEAATALARHFGDGVTAHPLRELPSLMARTDLLVNATSQGMHGQPPLILDLEPLKRSAVVYDIVYVPLETALLRDAKARGHRAV